MPPDYARREVCTARKLCALSKIVGRAETEPPSTMMLSQFSGGDSEFHIPAAHVQLA